MTSLLFGTLFVGITVKKNITTTKKKSTWFHLSLKKFSYPNPTNLRIISIKNIASKTSSRIYKAGYLELKYAMQLINVSTIIKLLINL